jgi:ABC-type enterochelin transport system permease subunit
MSRIALVLRRFVVVGAIAFWVGGFTFYTGVVVHVGAAALHSHRRQGFVTEHVTNWLNLSGAIALIVLLWELLASRATAGSRWVWRTMFAAWLLMAVLQVSLAALHPMMDRVLNPDTREILDEPRFGNFHDAYVWISTIQWCAALLFIFAMLWGWSAVSLTPLQRQRSLKSLDAALSE